MKKLVAENLVSDSLSVSRFTVLRLKKLNFY